MIPSDAYQFWLRYSELVSRDAKVIIETGVRQSTLSTWKKKNTYPRADVACQIAHSLNTTVEYLVKGEDENGSDPPDRELNIINSLNEKEFQIVMSLATALIELRSYR
jgi:transcriptional regulator with XRE-family HTH domain